MLIAHPSLIWGVCPTLGPLYMPLNLPCGCGDRFGGGLGHLCLMEKTACDYSEFIEEVSESAGAWGSLQEGAGAGAAEPKCPCPRPGSQAPLLPSECAWRLPDTSRKAVLGAISRPSGDPGPVLGWPSYLKSLPPHQGQGWGAGDSRGGKSKPWVPLSQGGGGQG